MFGYVTADPALLTEEERRRYGAAYCGLCRTLRREFSSLSRLTLNYDMTFLVLLLNALYEPPEVSGEKRCAAHPRRPQPFFHSRWTAYGAAMNVMLAYYNCLDDWHDDRSVLKWGEARLLRGACHRAAGAYPRQAAAVEACLARLSEIERRGLPDPDGAANCFGALMGALFVPDPESRWAADLYAAGAGLGRFIYTLDAVLDLPEDLRKGRYNPLLALAAGRRAADFQDELSMLIGESAAAFERLPLVQDAALLRNILYSGVWLRYRRAVDGQTAGEGGPPP
ncbi:MAG: hypothetical protein HFF17_06155 [Oscillospiraceae bacterium]|nr:hypothetical protein [Oscillospiraceae bacterium]